MKNFLRAGGFGCEATPCGLGENMRIEYIKIVIGCGAKRISIQSIIPDSFMKHNKRLCIYAIMQLSRD